MFGEYILWNRLYFIITWLVICFYKFYLLSKYLSRFFSSTSSLKLMENLIFFKQNQTVCQTNNKFIYYSFWFLDFFFFPIFFELFSREKENKNFNSLNVLCGMARKEIHVLLHFICLNDNQWKWMNDYNSHTHKHKYICNIPWTHIQTSATHKPITIKTNVNKATTLSIQLPVNQPYVWLYVVCI